MVHYGMVKNVLKIVNNKIIFKFLCPSRMQCSYDAIYKISK